LGEDQSGSQEKRQEFHKNHPIGQKKWKYLGISINNHLFKLGETNDSDFFWSLNFKVPGCDFKGTDS